jgi:hypothetical protein
MVVAVAAAAEKRAQGKRSRKYDVCTGLRVPKSALPRGLKHAARQFI